MWVVINNRAKKIKHLLNTEQYSSNSNENDNHKTTQQCKLIDTP